MIALSASTLLAAYRAYVAVMRSYGVFTFGTLQSDQGPEYVSEEAFEFCDEHAINRLLSIRYTAPQNGTAEAVFGVFIPRTRAILRAAGMDQRFWALGFSHAVWVGNRTHRLVYRMYADLSLAQPTDRQPASARAGVRHHCLCASAEGRPS